MLNYQEGHISIDIALDVEFPIEEVLRCRSILRTT